VWKVWIGNSAAVLSHIFMQLVGIGGCVRGTKPVHYFQYFLNGDLHTSYSPSFSEEVPYFSTMFSTELLQ
jgi:hypothetical protein